MRTIHSIHARLHHYQSGPLPGSDIFLERFADYQYGKTKTFHFSEERTADEAVGLLEKYGLTWERFYVFELEPSALKEYPAVYLVIESIYDLIADGVVDASQIGSREIARDYASEDIVVSNMLIEVIQSVAPNINWSPIKLSDGREWRIMSVDELLPEPIVIPLAVEIEEYESPKGVFSVRSDGRDVITNNNVKTLAEAGIAVVTQIETNSEVLKCKPRYIASGKVLDALQNAGAKGLIGPVAPLLIESHPLSGQKEQRGQAQCQ